MAGRLQATRRWLALVLGGALTLGVLGTAGAHAEPRSAMVIALDGAIGPGTAGYVVDSLRAAQQRDVAIVILRLDTPGGLDSAMRDIIRAILAAPMPVIAYVAPGGARAASAGTYILYAAALAAMAPGTNLGAATPVSLFGATTQPGSETGRRHDVLLEKVTNDAAAYIRGLAVLHGRNADWAERAVREAVSLPYDAALREHIIDLIAADVPDLLAQANGRTVVVQGKPVRLETSELAVVSVRPGWRDQLLELMTDPSIVYLLLLAGLAGVAFELSHPGVFAPGVIGTICLLVGGYGLNLLPIDYAGLALVLFGLGLMAAEAFLPAFGAFVLGGATAFAIGSMMLFETPGLRLPVELIVGATLAAAALFGLALTLLVRARRRPLQSGAAELIGLQGQVLGCTGREGFALIQGELWRARAVQPLQPGQTVRVVGRDGLTLLVEAA